MVFLENAIANWAANLGMSYPDALLIVIVLACFIIFSLGARIGLLFSTVTIGFSYVGFYMAEMPTANILTVFFICLVLLALSFFLKPGRGLAAV